MKIMALDPKATHANNPDCPMRLVPAIDGKNWMCVDCGCYIIHTLIEVQPVPDHIKEVAERLGGELSEVHGRPPITKDPHS